MKKDFHKWSGFLVLMLVLFLLTIPANAKTEQKIKVKVEIPLFQQVKVIKKKNIDYYSLMENYNGSKEILIEDALVFEIWSNAEWQLKLNNNNSAAKIQIKKSSQNESKWQNLNSNPANFIGKNGVQKINFDLKFILKTEKPQRKIDDNNPEINLVYNIEPLLY